MPEKYFTLFKVGKAAIELKINKVKPTLRNLI